MKKTYKSEIRVYLETASRDAFQERYPFTLSKFIRACMNRAISSREFFESVYFGANEWRK